MRRLAFVALAAVAFLAAPPVRAHWENTRWGMSEAQVRALYPGARPLPAPAGTRRLQVDGAFSVGAYRFSQAVFHFDTQGRLSGVKFPLTGDPTVVQRDLVKTYGAGVVHPVPVEGGGGTLVLIAAALAGDAIGLAYGTSTGDWLVVSTGFPS